MHFPLSRLSAAVIACASAFAAAQSPDPAAAAPGAPPAATATAQPAASTDSPLDASGKIKSNVVLKGKRFYIAEYRVMFEVGGKVSANTRAAYFGGVDRGGTRVTVNYKVPAIDVKAFQEITDKAYADFLARMEAAGAKPEPADVFVKENGAVYESTVEGSKPGAEVYEEVDLGHGKRKYLVMAPTGTKMVARSFIGMGAGNISKRIDYSKTDIEAVSMGVAVNVAAQESSGSASAMFRRESTANAAAAMEVTSTHRMNLLQTHARGGAITLTGALPVPGQFGNLREVGGYDTTKDPAMKAISILGALTMGVATNQSKTVDYEIDIDKAALARQSLEGINALNKAAVGAIQ